jgi:hypothetical protein
MRTTLYINNSQYLSYGESDNVLLNDSRLINNGKIYIFSGKYYGSSTCIGEKGWIGYWNDETNSLENCIEVELSLKIQREGIDDLIHCINVTIPNNFTPSNMSFEVDDKIIKRIFVRDLHRFARPIPLEISGIEFEL